MILSVGDKAPDFTMECTDGTFTLSERTRDGPVLIYFYVVNYGKTCTDYMAEMNERKADFDRRGVQLVHLNPESIENHRDWMRHTDSRYEIISDADMEVSRTYGCVIEKAANEKLIGKTNRALCLVDRDMVIRYLWRAPVPKDTVPMDDLFEEMDRVLG